MSLLSGKTKKVSVYGRKAEVRVVNRQSAFTSLVNDENDPFGFFEPQAKPEATHGKSRASILPIALLSKAIDSDDEPQPEDHSAAYDTTHSSLSFHSACSSASTSATKLPQTGNLANVTRQRQALASKILNNEVRVAPKADVPDKARKAFARSNDIDATPKKRRSPVKKQRIHTPRTAGKAITVATHPSRLPKESTPPPSQTFGRAPRRAAQAARSAIEDYDFTDRDMTPRRPVPTKSYFQEKARQLAELTVDKERDGQKSNRSDATRAVGSRPRKTIAIPVRGNPRKSMAARPQQTSTLGQSPNSAIAITDSSLSSATGVSDSSFEGTGTSQSSFSILGQSSDESRNASTNRSSVAKNKNKQNKRATRRILATSDDEEEANERSEDESERDSALQLAAQVADLAIADGDDATTRDDHLRQLLATVSQLKPETFSGVIQRLRASTSPSKASSSSRRLEKIGEASYSEVFKISASSGSTSTASGGHEAALVLKIIPVSGSSSSATVADSEDLPYTSPAADVEREIRLMKLIGRESSITNSFVSLRAVHVVRGAYPAPLLQAWDRWDAKRRTKTGEGAENIRPHVLGRQQVYALLVMSDGGMDLESLKVRSWTQAASIFQQVASGLGYMESKYQFEHRDLHWGNILVQSVPQEPSCLAHVPNDDSSWLLDPRRSGVKATIIDFTLSRARASPVTRKSKGEDCDILFYSFDDETLFDGSGDPQFDVYREMRSVTRDSWQAYCPATNVFWLRYLVHKLVDVKCTSIRLPKALPLNGDADALRERQAFDVLQRAAAGLDGAAQMLLLEARPKKGPVAGRKSLHPKARKSVLPTSTTAGVRKGRATMLVTPLQLEGSDSNIRSAAELVSFLN